MHIGRCVKIINQTINKLDLNLNGLTVLTEIGSGYFLFTPLIAILAGCKKVYVVVNDSRFGNGEDIIIKCYDIFEKLGVDKNLMEYSINSVPNYFIENANIITNSGHLRPLNEEKLQHASSNCVIPIMYEKWELRPEDIDVEYCNLRKIKTAGTWENHPQLLIFNYCKHLMLKLIFEAGFEIYKNNIIIFSSDHYGELLYEACENLGANKIVKTSNVEDVYHNIENCDFVFFCDYNNKYNLLTSEESIIDIDKIISLNDSVGIIHLVGSIDNDFVKSKGLSIYPDKKGFSQRMTETLAYLGPEPILRLQTAGLKVGESLIKNTLFENLVQI